MLNGFSLWCSHALPPSPAEGSRKEHIQQAWLDLAASLVFARDYHAYRAVMQLGGAMFPEHYVGVVGDMNHPIGMDEDGDPDWDGERQHMLFETLAYSLALGKRKGWTL